MLLPTRFITALAAGIRKWGSLVNLPQCALFKFAQSAYRFGCVDRDVGVGILPEGQKVLIGLARKLGHRHFLCLAAAKC